MNQFCVNGGMVNGGTDKFIRVINYEEKSILKPDNHTRLIFSRILLTIKYILCNLDNSNFAHSNLVFILFIYSFFNVDNYRKNTVYNKNSSKMLIDVNNLVKKRKQNY